MTRLRAIKSRRLPDDKFPLRIFYGTCTCNMHGIDASGVGCVLPVRSTPTYMHIIRKTRDHIMSIPLCSNYQRGIPMKDRAETVSLVNTLLGTATAVTDPRGDESSCYGEGPMILSDIPQSSLDRPIVLGIDEAGRGSVVGPMIYGMCYWYADAQLEGSASTGNCDVVIPKDFNDSKQLNEAQRNCLFDTILASHHIGFGIRVFPASEISRNMLRPYPYNLNQMSHNAAISIIRSLQQTKQVQIQSCYIDTVGNASSYQRRLEQEFPGVEFVVESKADDTYPPCSAASIGTYACFIFKYICMYWDFFHGQTLTLYHLFYMCTTSQVAKVVRDRMISNGTFHEIQLNQRRHSMKIGSGYPSDPICKEWLTTDGMIDPIFTFPSIVRFSWAPIKKLILQKATLDMGGENTTPPFVVPIVFAADIDNEEGDNDSEKYKVLIGMKRQQEQMSIFLGKSSKCSKSDEVTTTVKRLPYFTRRKLQPVLQL